LILSLFGKKGKAAVPVRKAPAFDNMNNFILVVLDSCRFDTFMEAAPSTIMKLGDTEARYSYASWTAPSHYNMLMGLMPHTSPAGVFASDYYKHDFVKYNQRLGARDIEFRSLVPGLWMPDFLRDTLGYRTHAMVSLPVLNSMTPVNRGFDTFRLMDRHNDMNEMIDLMTFPGDRPSFYLLNVGETHYPYARPTEAENEWPRISGVHGVFKSLDHHVINGAVSDEPGRKSFFDRKEMEMLRSRQVDTVQYLDGVFERLFDTVPKNTWITVTSDHGELFGEDGYFGHGPVFSEKVFQVPFLEGRLR
jgi:hypothetical protein